MKSHRVAAFVFSTLWLAGCTYFATCGTVAKPIEGVRPATWAQPIQKPGLPNLNKVSDDLYRGAQPTAEGVRELKSMGIKTIVNLRASHADSDLLGDTGLACELIPMTAWHAETEDAIKFLKIVTDKSRGPFFVHCLHGADRTGTMCAVYRIVVQGWSKDEAIREMKEGGFRFHPIYRNLPKFVETLDVEGLKRQIGSRGKEPETP